MEIRVDANLHQSALRGQFEVFLIRIKDVEITVSFDADDNLQQVSKITKGGKTITTDRSFKIANNQLVLTQSCNGKTGARYFDRQ